MLHVATYVFSTVAIDVKLSYKMLRHHLAGKGHLRPAPGPWQENGEKRSSQDASLLQLTEPNSNNGERQIE